MRTHTFFLKILSWNEAKMEFKEGDTECLGKWQLREKVNSHRKFEGKLKIVLKTALTVQNTRFSQLIQVANQSLGHPPKHFKPKDLKNLLSIFRDWKSHSQGSYELSHENLCVPLANGPFTREQVTKIDSQARDCGMRLGWSTTESPKQGNTVFEIFSFCKNKILSKNT